MPRHWVGDGFHVHPSFGRLAFTENISPFLMCDHAAPKEFPPTVQRRGVGQHPHRGFETVTLAYQGEVEHADSLGNTDVIGTGDVQWMTAGRGIIHEEFHSRKFADTGGTFEMIQLWVNLPKKNKMVKPRYQPITTKQIPVIPLTGQENTDSGHIRVIAGEVNGTQGPATTFTPINLWDVALNFKDTEVTLDVPEGHNSIVFCRQGGVTFVADGEETEIEPHQVALLKKEGTKLTLRAPQRDTHVFLLTGEPIDEPIAARGPFVMNTQAELRKANEDFYAGRMGK